MVFVDMFLWVMMDWNWCLGIWSHEPLLLTFVLLQIVTPFLAASCSHLGRKLTGLYWLGNIHWLSSPYLGCLNPCWEFAILVVCMYMPFSLGGWLSSAADSFPISSFFILLAKWPKQLWVTCKGFKGTPDIKPCCGVDEVVLSLLEAVKILSTALYSLLRRGPRDGVTVPSKVWCSWSECTT